MIVQTASGEIWGWGDNSYGVLGTAPTETYVTSPTKIALPQGVTSVSVSAGYDHVLMLGSDGNVYAWGNNEYGQLGQESAQILKSPTIVAELRQKNVIAVSAGKQFSLALTDGGRVYSFGRNDKLQLGYAFDGSFPPSYSATPTLIDALSGVFVEQINAGYDSATSVAAGGKVYLWGSNANNVLCLADSSQSYLPTAFPNSKIKLPVLGTDLSVNHAALLLENGKITFLGRNSNGQFGGNKNVSQSGSADTNTVDTSLLRVAALAVADTQTVLLTVDGKVYTAGVRNPNDPSSQSTDFVALFGEQANAPAAVAIAAGYRNGAMIAQDGSVWTWGDNSCGQLANGKSGDEGKTEPTKVSVSGDSDFDMGQAPTVMGVPIKVTTSVPAPTYAIKIPATIDVGELRQTDEESENRYSLTKFTVTAENVGNLFGEKEIQVAVASGDASGIFVLKDGNGGSLPFELFAEESAQTLINSGDVFARFTSNGNVDTWIRIDQSKITQSGIYNGVLIFSYTATDIGN